MSAPMNASASAGSMSLVASASSTLRSSFKRRALRLLLQAPSFTARQAM